MKTKFRNRFLAFALVLLIAFSSLPISAFAQGLESIDFTSESDEEGSYTTPSPEITDKNGNVEFPLTFRDVSTSAELEAALADGIEAICIVADFEIDRTFYISSDTIIYSEKQVTLTRNNAFAGDIFVVGQDSTDTLCEEKVIFSLGGYSTDGSRVLTINGNSENMTVDVVGTVVFVCPGAQADLYDNLTITNCKKVGNERTLNSIYELSNTAYVGGAAVILSKDSYMNVYGGTYSNNSVNTTGNSVYGGTFYNFATMNFYGGVIEGGSAARAGAIYNYRTLCIYNATIRNNSSTTSGGAIYLPASTGAKLYLGGENEYCDSQVTFSQNTAAKLGGAIYSSGRVTAQDTIFSENSATEGGAVFGGGSYNALSFTSSVFEFNTATEIGGAISASGHTTLNIDNDLTITNSKLDNNTAENGGAISIDTAAVMYGNNLSFTENSATTFGGAIYSSGGIIEIDNAKMSANEAISGGAIYLGDSTVATLNKIEAQENNSSNYGGFLYTNASTSNIYNCNVKGNTAKAGSAIYFASSAVTGIYGSIFTANACQESNTGNAGALFVYTGAYDTIIHSCSFVQNTSSGLGGAIFVSGKSNLKLYDITAIENGAAKGGFMYETTASTVVTISGLTVSGNTATTGGPIIWGNTANAKLSINKTNYVDLDTDSALDSTYWASAIYNKLTVTENNDAIPSYTDYSGEVISGLWEAVLVKSFEELEAAILSKKPLIKIVNDIVFDKTLYITSDTTVFTTTYCELSRADGFTGSLFVVGTDSEGNEGASSLTLGLSTSQAPDLMVIDGGVASSSLITVSDSSELNVYDNVTITNCQADGSIISTEENATANIYGGNFTNNTSNGDSVVVNAGTLNILGGSFKANSSVNGVIYNLGKLTMTGGAIEENTATNGGAIYNLGELTLSGGAIKSNIATENGGAIYMADGALDISNEISSNTALNGGAIYLAGGTATITDATISSSSADNGGAIYLDNSSVNLSLATVTFEANTANNGGAIYLANGSFDVNDLTFKLNSALNGGAIFVENGTLNLSNDTFKLNSATNGGAIYANASTVVIKNSYAEANNAKENGGFICAIDSSVTSSANEIIKSEALLGGAFYLENATLSSFDDDVLGGLASEGGAIYTTFSDITVKSSTLSDNTADYNGGALAIYDSTAYITGAELEGNSSYSDGGAIFSLNSTLTVYSTSFANNSAKIYGGAVAICEGSTAKIFESTFTSNSASVGGGAVYTSNLGTNVILQLCEFTENSSTKFGGALYACNQAEVEIYNTTANKNSALRGGFIYLADDDTKVTVIDLTVSSNSATNGTLAYGNNSGATLYINKEAYVDANVNSPDSAYWKKAIAGVATTKVITDNAPEFIEEGNEPAGAKLENATEVSSADELEAALAAKKKAIKIIADFEIDRTFYITYNVTIFSTAYHTLTRASDFGSDIFVIGEDANGTNTMLESADDMLTLGNPDSTTKGLLTIDGNRDNMTVDVYGTVLFVCSAAKVNLYENLSVVNCYKVDNERTYNEHYKLSRPNRVGGAVGIIPYGTINVYGGTYKNNAIKLEDASTEEGRNSSNGGVFYNESNLKIYGGLFEGNVGHRGGIVYNYANMKVYGGSFIANHATGSGGVYYSTSSAVGQLHIGYNSDSTVLFKDNTSATNGGVITSSTLNGIVIHGNTIFENNQALGGSGGAIHTSSSFTIKNAIFKDNSAKSRGGAIFVTKSTQNYVTRFVSVESSSFIGNHASTGGAVALYCANSTYEEGSIVNIDGCEFISNTASYGGVLSTERKSILTVNNSTFTENSAENEAGVIYILSKSTANFANSTLSNNTAGSHGGAISIRSATLNLNTTTIENNHSDKNGGAMYIAYSSDIDCNSSVTIEGSTIKGNASKSSGGAIYATRRAIENDTNVLNVYSSDFAQNKAKSNGGAILLTASVDVFMKNASFVSNSISDNDGVGGAIAALSGTLEIDGGVFTKNRSECTGGAIHISTGATVTLNSITASRNSTRTNGGFIYSVGTLDMYNSSILANSANMGGGIYLYENATGSINSTEFARNTSKENGAGLFIYTFGTPVSVNSCSFDSNQASGVGGAMYISGKSVASLYNIEATSNHANKGGFLYETAAGTVVTMVGVKVQGNTADDGGAIIWGNTKNADLYINKSSFTDLDYEGALGDEYWSSAIEGALTVIEITDSAPSAPKYNSVVEKAQNATTKSPVSVDEIFNLAENSSDGYINSTYDKLPVLDNSSNFMSREETIFENINGETVTVDTFVYPKYSTAHNMTVGEALMIYQAMLYKQANPDEDVSIDIASYRFSVQTAVNINRDSRYFGYTRQLPNSNYDKFGFVRVAYLLVCAAKMGIHVNVLAHRDAYPIVDSIAVPTTVIEYFDYYLNDPCDPIYQTDKVVDDYLDFTYFDWTLSEGGKGGTDMMHTKLCAVSHYLDMNGKVHKNAVWTSSSNLDGITSSGYNANWKLQTATIISDHEYIYRTSVNYLRLMTQLSGQEQILEFQNIVNVESTKQIDLILAGRGDEIPADEQLVYIGTENDDVFELYFTPFGGDILAWDETYNPYSKYLRELYESEDYIVFTWNAAEYSGKFPLGQHMEQMIIDAFHNNKNPNNKIYVNMESFDPTTFDDLEVGVDIGFKSINKWELGAIHNKDLQFSYVKNGQRYYVSLLNSCNLHSGSMYFQSNFALVIKETSCADDSVFSTVAKYSTTGDLVTHTFGEEIRQEPTENEHGYIYKECTSCGEKEIIDTIHVGGEWIVEKIATPTENGIRYKKCTICDMVLESEETKFAGATLSPENNTGTDFTYDTTLPVTLKETPLTIEATILLKYEIEERGGVILGNYSSMSDENAINLEIFTGGRVRLFSINNGIRTDVVFSTDIRSQKPVHIAITADETTYSLYVDGVLKETINATNALPIIDKGFMLGGDNRQGDAQTFKGTIYSVSAFSDVRTADEIKQDMEYVAALGENVLLSKYFTSGDPGFIEGASNGSSFNSDDLNETGKLDSQFATLETTIMLPTDYEERGGVILGSYVDGNTNGMNLEVLAGGYLRLFYLIDGIRYDYSFTTDIRSDKPINIAVTIDGTIASLYVDGVFTESITLAKALPSTTNGLVIGGDYRSGNAQYFKGTIYSLHLFSSVKTEEEIKNDIYSVNENDESLLHSSYFTSNGRTDKITGQKFDNSTIASMPCDIDKTPLTFEAVIQLSTNHYDRGGVILGNYSSTFDENAINLEVFTDGKVRLFYINGGTRAIVLFNTDIRSDEPVHIAVTVDGSKYSLFVNGELKETQKNSLPLPDSSTGYHIGGDLRKDNTQYFKGTIYSVALFDHARSEEQIKSDVYSIASGDGLLYSTSFMNPSIVDKNSKHKDLVLEIITSATPKASGSGRLVCEKCGEVVALCSIPYMADGIIHNDYTSKDSALGAEDYYVINDKFSSTPMTFEFLLHLATNYPNAERGGILLGNYDGTSANKVNLEIYTNGQPRLWYKVGSTSYSYVFNTDIRSDKNVHLTFTIDGLSASLYVDGELIETVTLTTSVPFDGSKLYVGTDARISSQSFKGEIYSASIFSDIRTAEEIRNDMIMITSDTDNVLFSKYFVKSEAVHVKGPWADKSAIFVGDSITAGTNCNGSTYWELLKEYLELESSEGMGIAGSCISSTSDYGNEYDPLINRYESIPEADLIAIFMGTNDYGHDTPIGSIDDTGDVSFYGALNTIIPALMEKYPDSTIVFITPLHRYGFGTNSATGEAHTFDYIPNGRGHTLEEYVNAIITACEKYSVPVVDVFSTLELDPSLDEAREYYMEDGLHPNAAGHRLIAEFLTHYLEELANSKPTE